MSLRILTSDEFVAGIMAVLALQDKRKFVLSDTDLDQCFEQAYDELIERQSDIGVTPNFSFYVESFHGDSGPLRDALLAAREKKLIAFHNPKMHRFDIKLSTERAQRYLTKNPIPQDVLEQIVEKFFNRLEGAYNNIT